MHTGVHNNIALLNANNRYKANTGKKVKSSEKLASGYRINRSADDAAGLAISEKMRMQIRALNKGTENAQNGISWVQTGDGALDEVHAILQRMRELTIQSLNDTNTERDRAACQAEFDALQSEIDKICEDTEFNTQNIFDEHELPYYQCEGNVEWEQSEKHIVASDKNELIIQYRTSASDVPKEAKIQVPAGVYTTQELIDEIEDAAIASGLDAEGFRVEYTQFGTCNLNFEGGEVIDSIGGGLSYLFYDMYEGGGFGALIGTTVFVSENVRLEIKEPNNNYMEFQIEDFNGNSETVQIDIPDGEYTRQELIDYLNGELQGKDVTAVAYGTGIKLEGTDRIVTGFKGNMFKIDEGSKIYHSVFYDNVNYGNITMTPASFTGGAIKPTDSNSEEYQKFVITSANNQLVLSPNGGVATTLTIPDGTYTVTDMKNKLNELLAENNLENELVVTEFQDSYGYKGLKITSLVEGVTSEVGIDSSKSSAYDTLFTKKEYNTISKVYPKSDGNADRDAYILGAENLSSGLPIDSTNNQFKVLIKNANGTEEVTITLADATNSSLNDIISQMNTQLSGKGVTVTEVNGRIKILGNAGSGVESITAKAVDGNNGYEDIFVKKEEKVTYDTLSGTSVTLPDIPAGGFDDTNNKITISVGGTSYDVTLPTGNPTETEIIKAIEDAIPEQTIITDNTFTRVYDTGSSTDRNFTVSNTGKTTVVAKTYSATGSSTEIEGAPGVYENNTPAEFTMAYAVPSSITIDDTCNNLQLNINGKELSLTIENGTYTSSQLVNKVQEAIDNVFGKYYGGATVSLNEENKLVFKARLEYADGYKGPGAKTSISCSTNTSNFLKKLHTIDTPATVTSTANVLSNIVITSENNSFDFTLNDQKVSVELPKGIYATPAALVTELNKALDKANYKVTASLANGKLCLTTDETGDNCSIGYSSNNGGSSSLAIFGDLTKKSPAEIIPAQTVQESIAIDDNSNQFVITVNGAQQTLTLTNGTYTRSSFLTMLNNHLKDIGVTASYSGNRLKYTTEKTGADASLEMSYETGGSSMLAIYGQTTEIIPGVDAEFENGKLVLKGTQSGTTIKVFSADNNAFFKPTKTEVKTGPTTIEGYSSTMKSFIDGRSLTGPITIDEYSNNLTFVYHDDGTSTTVSIAVDTGADGKKTYTYDELKTELQSKIDTAVGADKLEVSVTADGVRIEAKNAGNKYTMSSFSGDFYNKIICTTTKQTSILKPTVIYGSQTKDEAYAVGRKDIRNKTTLIRDNVNDTLSLDFSYGGQTVTFNMELDAGEYSGDALVAEIQKKLNEQLVTNGLAENLIEVGIGGVSTGVTGSNDQNALVFKLSETVKLPAEGQYIIDGVRGNAAFSIFYQTDGELEPAYLGGTKDISEGVTIKDGETALSFKVDGTEYSIDIPADDYTAEEIIDKMNELLSAQNIPAVAENYENTIRLTYPSLGKHTISDVSGGAKEEVFFQENGQVGERQGVMIQMSGNVSDNLEIERPIVNTCFLKINSIAITSPKYANKALGRLDYAMNRVSEIRSGFGSMQNRLEHAVANNRNTSENTQVAESQIRDTDMATEMMNQAKYVILQQATEAIMAHEKVQAQNIIKLLQV